MDEIDMIAFFKELTLKEDVENFVKHKKVPGYFNTTKANRKQYNRIKETYPVMDERVDNAPEYNKENYINTINVVRGSLDKCENIIQTMRMTEDVPEVECCPVCFTEFEDSNYVIPKCKHKVCAICFTNNIKYNKHSGDCCVLCRQRVC